MKKTRQLNIMMVDDSATLRALLHRTLMEIDNTLELVEFPTGDEALEYHALKSVDMFLLDINMPGKDGIETLIDLKKTCPDCFVVMVTANKSNNWVIKAKKFGANGYIAKPFSPDKLIRVLDSCVRFHELLAAKSKAAAEDRSDVVEL